MKRYLPYIPLALFVAYQVGASTLSDVYTKKKHFQNHSGLAPLALTTIRNYTTMGRVTNGVFKGYTAHQNKTTTAHGGIVSPAILGAYTTHDRAVLRRPATFGRISTTRLNVYSSASGRAQATVSNGSNSVIIDPTLGGIRLKNKALAFDDLQFVISPKDPTPGTCHPAQATLLTPLEEYIFAGATPVPPTGCGSGEYEHVNISSVELPHNWALLPGTTNALGDFHIHMASGASGMAAGQKAKWKLSVSCSALNGSAFTPVRTMFAQYSASSTVAATTSLYVQFGQFTSTRCAGIGSNLKTRIARVPKNAGGTEAVDPFLMQLGLHMAIDGFGSNDSTSYGTKSPTP